MTSRRRWRRFRSAWPFWLSMRSTRRMLEWETAAATAARATGLAGRGVRHFVGEMQVSPLIACVVALAIAVVHPRAFPSAIPLLVLWVLAPAIAYWLSIPVGARVRPLEAYERALIRRIARKTWRFFETFVTEADGWLPADNFQEDVTRVARRPSPTNIGMAMLSTLAAHDLGYLSTRELVRRLDATLTTLEGLERYNGHFLNWYDTFTREPLHPRYVSTVDSGNLAAALIALSQGLLQLEETPQTREQRLAGLSDTAGLLAAVSASATGAASRDVLTTINRLAREIASAARRAADEGAGDVTGIHAAAAELAARLEALDPQPAAEQ